MPTRNLQRFAVFDVETLYTQFLSSQPGWTGGSSDDIESMIWEPTTRTLVIYKVIETGLQRRITYTAIELWNLVKNLTGWSGGTALDIQETRHDVAGRKLIIIKALEGA